MDPKLKNPKSKFSLHLLPFTELLLILLPRLRPPPTSPTPSPAASSAPGPASTAPPSPSPDLFPFLRLSFLVSNQAIIKSMDAEKVVHYLQASDPTQCLALLQALATRPEGPPHLRISSVSESKEVLSHMAIMLLDEAEKLDIPFQFNPIISQLDCLDFEALKVKTGDAVAVNSVLHLHSVLAYDDEGPQRKHKNSSMTQLHRMAHMGQGGTLGELLEKDVLINGLIKVLERKRE